MCLPTPNVHFTFSAELTRAKGRQDRRKTWGWSGFLPLWTSLYNLSFVIIKSLSLLKEKNRHRKSQLEITGNFQILQPRVLHRRPRVIAKDTEATLSCQGRGDKVSVDGQRHQWNHTETEKENNSVFQIRWHVSCAIYSKHIIRVRSFSSH